MGEIVFTRRSVAGFVVCVWLVGALTSGTLIWYVASTQQHRNVQFTYAINRGACAAYSLVDPTIRANNTLIVALKRSIDDPTTSSAMLAINKKRLKTVNQQNTAFQSFRAIYGTIPLDFDCHRLSKQPPS